MSLDVSLVVDYEIAVESTIFIRENGQNKPISVEEWNLRNPDRPAVSMPAQTTNEVFEWNITHNLGGMARQVTVPLYDALWCPDEHGYEQAHQIIPILEAGLEELKAGPDHFKYFNPKNGWGNYDGLVRFVEAYLEACRKHPYARVEADR